MICNIEEVNINCCDSTSKIGFLWNIANKLQMNSSLQLYSLEKVKKILRRGCSSSKEKYLAHLITSPERIILEEFI